MVVVGVEYVVSAQREDVRVELEKACACLFGNGGFVVRNPPQQNEESWSSAIRDVVRGMMGHFHP